jgi:hypothetical protein
MRKTVARGLAVVLCAISVALAADSPAIREVRARYAECVALEKRPSVRTFEFGRVLQGNDLSLGPWRAYKTLPDSPYEYMIVYVLNGRVRSVGLEQSSPSGDWVSDTSYCYRTDGSLAFQYQVLNTFHSTATPGPLRVETRSYHTPAGRRVSLQERLLNTKTRQAIRAEFLRFNPPAFSTSAAVVKVVGRPLLPAR